MQDTTKDYIGHRKRIRDRFNEQGLEVFSDYEALELLITWMIPRRDVKPEAKRLIRRFGNFRSVLDATPNALIEVEGIGESTATGIHLCRAIMDRYLGQVAARAPLDLELQDLRAYCQTRLGNQPVEVFHVFCIDSAQRIIKEVELQRGTIDRATIYPRQVIEEAMKSGASHLVLVHNHPNEKAQPTEADKIITRAIVLAAAPLEIQIFDHLIVTKTEVFSFREAGLL